MDAASPIKLGNRELTVPGTDTARIAMLLWGQAGCGKSTLAATAPGHKLWVLFDPGGTDSLIGRDDIVVLDLSGEKHAITQRFKEDDPLGIERMLAQHPEIETVVFDSVTAYSLLATENAVANVTSATIENPGVKGYGHRSALVHRAVTSIMRLCKRLGRHVVFIAHEDSPTTNPDGVVIQITVSLSNKQVNNIGMQLSEIWWLHDDGKQHKIAVRPVRLRTPMKSRMFDISKVGEFVWQYDPDTQSGQSIAAWFNKWKEGGGAKLTTTA